MNMRKSGYKDVPMTRRRAQLLAEYADKLAEMLERAPDDKDLAEWVQSKIDRAAGSIQSAYHYLDQEQDSDDLEKAASHKYTHRKLTGKDKKTGKPRYRYYYKEHHGGGITRAKFEAGSAFKLTFKGRKGHFHVHSVNGDMVKITHDGRPGMKPVEVHKDELRALLKKQHSKALNEQVKKEKRKVEKLKRTPTKARSSLGLALHRLRQAAAKAGIELPAEYQPRPKKKRTKQIKEDEQRPDNFETMPDEDVSLKTKGQAARALQKEFEDAGLQGSKVWTVNEGTDREKARIYIKGQNQKQGYIEVASQGARDETGAFRLQVITEQGLENATETEIQEAMEKRRGLFIKYNIPLLSSSQLDAYLKAIGALTRKIKGGSETLLNPQDSLTLPLILNYTAKPLDQQTQAETKALRQQAFDLLKKEDRPQSETKNTYAVQIAEHVLRRTMFLHENEPRNELTETAQQIIQDADQDHDERHDEHQTIKSFELGEHTHTRTGQKLFTAKQKERTDLAEYRRRSSIAKKYKGRYDRRYTQAFLFRSAEDARNFALEVEGIADTAENAERVTPHDDHPSADNFETMPEVEGEPKKRLRGVLDALSDAERLNTINPKNRRRPKEAKGAEAKLIKLVNELAEDQDPNDKRFLKVMASMLQDVKKLYPRSAYERQRSRKDRYATIREFIEKKLGVEPTVTAPSLNEILSRPTAPKTRLIQQKTFDNETQGKITEVYSVLKDRVRLNKKGEVFAIKKPSTLYYGETPTGALAQAVSSATGLSRLAAYNIVNEAVGERRTLAEIQDLLGTQIVKEKKELIRKRPAAIRMSISNLHTNIQEKIRTYTAQFNPAMRHDQRSGIGLESIDLALDKRQIARNVSIYGTQDSVLTEEERRKVRYTTVMSAVSVVDRIAARYGNIAELRADAEGVKQTLETFARAVLERIKESAERNLRYVKGKIDAGVKDIKETDFKRDMLEARLTRAERETSFLDDPEATREEIREIREGLDEAEQILREDAERTAQWYSAEAQRRLAENSVKTIGELTAAIKSGTARHYIEAAVAGSAKEKLAARMFNEIMERLLVETKDQPIEQPPLDTPEPVEKPEGRVSAIASVINRQAEERAERRQRRLKEKQSALRETPIHKSITEALVNSLVVESDHAGTQGPTIKKLTDSNQSTVKNILLRTIANTIGTETRGKARELLMKQALGLGGAATGEARRFDSMLVKIQEALTPQAPLARARREVEEIVKRTMIHNLSASIEKVLKRFVAPRTTTSANRPMGLPHYRDLPTPETSLRDYRMTALYGAAYDRLARKYLSGRELEADAAEIKAKTKQAFRQRLDAQRNRNRDKYNEAFLEATNPNRDTADQRVQVLDHVQAMISTLGLESEQGQAGVSLKDQVEQIKRMVERNRAKYQAEIDANAQKQAEDLRYLKEEIKPKIMGDQAPAAEAQLLQDYLNDIEDSHNRTVFKTKRGRRFAEIQREALQELINELQSTPPKRISEFGEDLDARQNTDIRATTPRDQLTETAREVTQGADNFETMPEVESEPRQGAERRRKEALIRLRFRQLLSLQDQETTETLDAEENRLNELSSKLLRTVEEAEQKKIETQIQSLITEAREKVQRAEERTGEAAPELAPDPAQAIISDLMSLESDEIKQVERYIEGYKAERYKRAQKDLYIKELSKLLGDAIAGNYESLSERYSEQAIVQTLERLENEKNKPDLDNALVSPLLDKQPTASARQALTETTERATSDQTVEQATTRATPRPSEATLRGSGELNETVRANLQDRAQFLTSGSEDTTKTGRRSKAQKAKDGELLLIHRRLQSDAQERLGPTAPRFADYSQLIGMPRADQPENAETRAQFRTALKDAIRELRQATSGRVTKKREARRRKNMSKAFSLHDTMIMIKAAQHKYTHRKLAGRDPKTGRARYRYYYKEHHGGGITSGKFEAGSAFKLTFKGRRGHFHIKSVEGDMVTITHDGRPGMKPVEIHKDELRALLKKQHTKAETKSREKAQANRRKGRKSTTKKRKNTAKKRKSTGTKSKDNFETTPEVEAQRDKVQGFKHLEKLKAYALAKHQTKESFTNSNLGGTGAKRTSQIVEYIDRASNTQLNRKAIHTELSQSGEWHYLHKVGVDEVDAHTHGDVEPSGREDLTKPIVINHKGEVIDGRHRVMLARKRGITELPAYMPASLLYEKEIAEEEEAQTQTPRDQLTETAREVTQGADNFETMPETEGLGIPEIRDLIKKRKERLKDINQEKEKDKQLKEIASEIQRAQEEGDQTKAMNLMPAYIERTSALSAIYKDKDIEKQITELENRITELEDQAIVEEERLKTPSSTKKSEKRKKGTFQVKPEVEQIHKMEGDKEALRRFFLPKSDQELLEIYVSSVKERQEQQREFKKQRKRRYPEVARSMDNARKDEIKAHREGKGDEALQARKRYIESERIISRKDYEAGIEPRISNYRFSVQDPIADFLKEKRGFTSSQINEVQHKLDRFRYEKLLDSVKDANILDEPTFSYARQRGGRAADQELFDQAHDVLERNLASPKRQLEQDLKNAIEENIKALRDNQKRTKTKAQEEESRKKRRESRNNLITSLHRYIDLPISDDRNEAQEVLDQIEARKKRTPVDDFVEKGNELDKLTQRKTRTRKSRAADKALAEKALREADTNFEYDQATKIFRLQNQLMEAQDVKKYEKATSTKTTPEDLVKVRKKIRDDIQQFFKTQKKGMKKSATSMISYRQNLYKTLNRIHYVG